MVKLVIAWLPPHYQPNINRVMVTASRGITAGHKYFCYRSQPNISRVVMLTVSWGITAGHPGYFGFSWTLENYGRETPGKVALWTMDAAKCGL